MAPVVQDRVDLQEAERNSHSEGNTKAVLARLLIMVLNYLFTRIHRLLFLMAWSSIPAPFAL